MFKSNLVQRLLSAAFLIPLLGWVVFWGPMLAFRIVVIIVFAGALWEALSMFRKRAVSNVSQRPDTSPALVEKTTRFFFQHNLFLVLFGTFIFSDIFLWKKAHDFGNQYVIGILMLMFLTSILALFEKNHGVEQKAELLITSVFSWVYVSLIGILVVLKLGTPQSLEDGRPLIALVLCLTWLTDTGAYAFGRLFGKNKLAPSISPGKTREGAIGGIFAAIAGTLIINQFYFFTFSTIQLIMLSFVASVAAQLGDLVESALKRYCGVKDSGNIIPGHGGILDRIDSILFVGAIIYAAIQLTYR